MVHVMMLARPHPTHVDKLGDQVLGTLLAGRAPHRDVWTVSLRVLESIWSTDNLAGILTPANPLAGQTSLGVDHRPLC